MVKNGELFLIDFGLATFYINDDKLHVPNTMNDCITGTPKYVSPHIHDGCRPARRDDLLSLGYIYIYMYANELPWDSVYTDVNATQYESEIHIMHSKNQQRKILKEKENIGLVCTRINTRIENYFRFCHSYDYFDKPQYISLCSLFTHDNTDVNT
jgi:casein kinase I family protein HRR25